MEEVNKRTIFSKLDKQRNRVFAIKFLCLEDIMKHYQYQLCQINLIVESLNDSNQPFSFFDMMFQFFKRPHQTNLCYISSPQQNDFAR